MTKKKLPILKYMAAFGTKKTSQFAYFFLWGGERRRSRKIHKYADLKNSIT